ncbi:MAG: peptidoglycan DD-metalloendopeptidase family protein [Gammaproteobacteria bacterium]|nr:peptidoglycan DD-metalloendopeptidase family protein [Gammaproteobacteria bacterium]
MRIFSWINIILCIVCFSACTTTETYAPVMDATQIEAVPKNGQYRVSANDTLYSIAWRYGLDYRDLAQRNHISRPYYIEVGEILYLTSNAPSPSSETPSLSMHNKSMLKAQLQLANVVIPDQKTFAYSSQPQKQLISKNLDSLEPTQKVSVWYRPAKGPIIATYSTYNKGLNFGGKQDAPIFATAAGKVVYSGNGLRGYGNLIIIKHNSTFLTAYAHNDKILVREGEWVQAKQKIAEMGSTGTAHVMLHFEIRRNGKPVNPLNYLT